MSIAYCARRATRYCLLVTNTLTANDLSHLTAVHATGTYDRDDTGEAVTRVPSTGVWLTSQQVEALLVDAS